MSDLRTAAQQALEALEWHYRQGHSNTLGGLRLKIDEKALRELSTALAQQAEPVQEPVAWADKISFEDAMKTGKGHDVWPKAGDYETRTGRALIGLYTAPPQRLPQTIDEAMRLPRAMAQAYENGYKAGVAHEREACERACKHQPHWVACVAAIRARSNQ